MPKRIEVVVEVFWAEELSSLKKTVHVTSETTISDLLEQCNFQFDGEELKEFMLFSGYYLYRTRQQEFPYIIMPDNTVRWNLPYKHTKVNDFLHTHSIKNNTLTADTIYLAMGGANEFFDYIELWQQFSEVVRGGRTIWTIWALLKGAHKLGYRWIASVTKEKQSIPSPHAFGQFIYSRETWNHYELHAALSSELSVTLKDIKKLLQGLGYRWDNSRKLYTKSELAHQYEQKLKNIDIRMTEADIIKKEEA